MPIIINTSVLIAQGKLFSPLRNLQICNVEFFFFCILKLVKYQYHLVSWHIYLQTTQDKMLQSNVYMYYSDDDYSDFSSIPHYR